MNPAIAWLLSVALSAASATGRDPELQVAKPPPDTSYQNLLERAYAYLGWPYAMGGVGQPAFDCSGFVCRVYARSGYALPRVSRDQAKIGEPVPLNQLRPGDLLFFAESGRPISHVGIYAGNNQIVHASSGQGEVVVADLSQRWFQTHLVSARRILTSTEADWKQWEQILAQGVERREHGGDFALPMTERRPAMLPPPQLGFGSMNPKQTLFSLSGQASRHEGKLRWVLLPEIRFWSQEASFFVALAMPMALGGPKGVDFGRMKQARDASRFLRQMSLGLPGADLFLSLSQDTDLSLLSGLMMAHLLPSSLEGTPGSQLEGLPLSFQGHLRLGPVSLEAVVDDVFLLEILGAASRVHIDRLSFGFGLMADRNAAFGRKKAALVGMEAELKLRLYESHRLSLHASLLGGRLSAPKLASVGGGVNLGLQIRGRRAEVFDLQLGGEILGPRFVATLFGPTYVVHQERQLESLESAKRRSALSFLASMQLGRVTLMGQFSHGLGPNRHRMDERLLLLAELRRIRPPLGRPIDLRLAVAMRRFLSRGPKDVVIQGGLRFHLSRWAALEGTVQHGHDTEFGLSLRFSYAP